MKALLDYQKTKVKVKQMTTEDAAEYNTLLKILKGASFKISEVTVKTSSKLKNRLGINHWYLTYL